jgi:hypothetical protein
MASIVEDRLVVVVSSGAVVANVGADHLEDRRTVTGRVVGDPFQGVERAETHWDVGVGELLDRLREAVGDLAVHRRSVPLHGQGLGLVRPMAGRPSQLLLLAGQAVLQAGQLEAPPRPAGRR